MSESQVSLFQRVRRIEMTTRRLVANNFAGAYHSIYKGRGLTFESLRPYVWGDDIRTIDWNVTARTLAPYVRQYVEERELSVMLVVDASPSVLFGTMERTKRDFAAELSATLAYSALFNQDRVGLLLFSDTIERYIPPRKGRKHALHLIATLLNHESTGKKTDISRALNTLGRTLRAGSIIFLLSDFLVPLESYLQRLYALSYRHQVISVVFSDPLEHHIPQVGLLALEDVESQAIHVVDTGSNRWREQHQQQRTSFIQARSQAFKRAKIAEIDLEHGGDYVSALQTFFRQQLLMRSR